MMEARAFQRAAGVAMRIDMDHADGSATADSAQDRIGDGMIAADGQRHHAGIHHLGEVCLDVGVRLLQAVAAAERHIADIRQRVIDDGRHAQHMLEWPDAFDLAHRPRAKPSAGAIGRAQIQRNADERQVQSGEVARPVRLVQQRRRTGVRQAAAHRVHYALEFGIVHDALAGSRGGAGRRDILVPQRLKLRRTDHHVLPIVLAADARLTQGPSVSARGVPMPQHIGIVACSAEGAALCYRTICVEGAQLLGPHAHPEVSMHTPSLADYVVCLERDDWHGVGELMLASARKLAAIGADFLICPDNTIHQALPLIASRSPLPWLHIADAVAEQAAAWGLPPPRSARHPLAGRW